MVLDVATVELLLSADCFCGERSLALFKFGRVLSRRRPPPGLIRPVPCKRPPPTNRDLFSLREDVCKR